METPPFFGVPKNRETENGTKCEVPPVPYGTEEALEREEVKHR